MNVFFPLLLLLLPRTRTHLAGWVSRDVEEKNKLGRVKRTREVGLLHVA